MFLPTSAEQAEQKGARAAERGAVEMRADESVAGEGGSVGLQEINEDSLLQVCNSAAAEKVQGRCCCSRAVDLLRF